MSLRRALACLLLSASLPGPALAEPATQAEKPLVYVSGADEGRMSILAREWPRLEPLPDGNSFDAPYPELRELLAGERLLLLIELRQTPEGMIVFGRAVAPGGFDSRLGTIYTTQRDQHLLEAVDSLFKRLSPPDSADRTAAYKVTVEQLGNELTGLSGFGTAALRHDLPPDRALIKVQQDAYQRATTDFLEQLDSRLHLTSLLDADELLTVTALVKSGLYVFRNERRTTENTFTVEVRLKPLTIRTLTRVLYRGLAAVEPNDTDD